MIHIATVHRADPRWIEIQLRQLERHTTEPYRTYGFLAGLEADQHARFDWSGDHTGRIRPEEPQKRGRELTVILGELVDQIKLEAEPDDLLVFMHSDTMPITDWAEPVRRILAERPLTAIRRDENYEPIPHWSFCVTTVGFWDEIGADWGPGPTWTDDDREATDMGARLWRELDRRGVDWHPLLRTNAVDLHPVLFGIYGDLVYHHGAGSRTPMTRRDAIGYAQLPIPLRNFAGVRRRIANTYRSERVLRRIRRDEPLHLELTKEGA